MVDGFVPRYEYFMKNRKSLEKKSPLVRGVLHRYSPKTKLSENRLLLLFDALLRAYRMSHCQNIYHFYDNNRPFECGELTLTTKQNWKSIENTVYRGIFKQYLPVLEREFKHHESKGFLNYTQNIVNYDPQCESCRKCALGWIKYFNFDVKKKNQYLDYASFKDAWEKILQE